MKRLFHLCLAVAALNVSAEVRPPAVSGSFYPDDPGDLRSQVEALLDEARAEGAGPFARALVVPHAGYVFSGPTAAKAFAKLPVEGVRRVILLGPSHHVSFGGGALPAKELTAFETPLGRIPLDLEALATLRKHRYFDGPSKAHEPEHSLEVELPFLQVVAPEAKLIPIAVGSATDFETCTRMAEALSDLLDDGTVIVASSDFTHHGRRYGWSPYDGSDLPATLLSVGQRTADRAAAMDPRGFVKQIEVSGDTVCGVRPVGILTTLLAHAFEGTGRVLEVTTSGHVSGSFDLSVTYAAIAYSGEWTAWREISEPEADELSAQQGLSLTALARATLRSHLTHDPSVADWFAEYGGDDQLLMPAGSFVTLNNTGRRVRKDGRLRACMGVIEARQPLVDAVVQAAVWASQDPRFPPLELAELDGLEVEVSVLSPMKKVSSFQVIEIGKHGVLMTKDGRRAVFLPQVAVEQGWNRDTMLEHLSVKAGLPREAWREGAIFEVFTAQVFKEHK